MVNMPLNSHSGAPIHIDKLRIYAKPIQWMIFAIYNAFLCYRDCHVPLRLEYMSDQNKLNIANVSLMNNLASNQLVKWVRFAFTCY